MYEVINWVDTQQLLETDFPNTSSVLELVNDCMCVCRCVEMTKQRKKKRKSPAWIDESTLDMHQQRKKRRIQEFAKVLKLRGRADYKKFLGEMQFGGLRKVVALEYLEAMKDMGMINIDEKEIVWNSEFEEDKS
jgi:hypothetical protein